MVIRVKTPSLYEIDNYFKYTPGHMVEYGIQPSDAGYVGYLYRWELFKESLDDMFKPYYGTRISVVVWVDGDSIHIGINIGLCYRS